MKRIRLWSVLSILLLTGCFPESEYPTVFTYTFDFSVNAEGWSGDFSDYPEGDSIAYELAYSYGSLPDNVSKTRKGFKLTGNNQSDDLFMFIKRKLTGFPPNSRFEVLFNVRFASNAPTEAFGIGGAPGESVIVKAGITGIEPLKELVDGYYQMNIDKGNQSESGDDMMAIGHVGVSPTTTQYTEIYRGNSSSSPFILTTNNLGEAWIIIGTDSGYEGTTTLYYTSLDLVFNQVY
jgi:hypothetical protein